VVVTEHITPLGVAVAAIKRHIGDEPQACATRPQASEIGRIGLPSHESQRGRHSFATPLCDWLICSCAAKPALTPSPPWPLSGRSDHRDEWTIRGGSRPGW
jgi:hypothetical protein